jgi:DNA-binding transcriptional regulator LsrR (DeoR family)
VAVAPPSVDRARLVTTVLAARRYFLDGATKSEIAHELGVSRFKVARLLDDALRDGIVRIEIDSVPDVDDVLSRELAVAHGIRSAIVVRTVQGPAEFQRSQLGRICATVLAESLDEGDVLGISWGRTLHAMVGHLPSLPACTVVQVVGSVPSLELDVNSLELVRRVAERAGGPVYPLHVPLIVDSPAVAAALRKDPHVSPTLAQFSRITRAIVGVGAWAPGGSTVRAALSDADAAELDAAGAVADVCSIVLDRDGQEVRAAGLPGRCISMSHDELRAVPDVVAVSAGPGKVEPIRAALRSGLVHRLITDEATARLLLPATAGTTRRNGSR